MVAIARIERGTGRVFLSIDEDSLRALSGLPDSPIDQLVVHDPLIGAITVSGRAERFSGELVSGNYFGALGVVPLAGRLLQPSDDVPGGTETPAVISERMWRRVFHADPDVIGRVGKIADHPVVIVGVVPAPFKGTWLPMILATDLWLTGTRPESGPDRAGRGSRHKSRHAGDTSPGRIGPASAGCGRDDRAAPPWHAWRERSRSDGVARARERRHARVRSLRVAARLGSARPLGARPADRVRQPHEPASGARRSSCRRDRDENVSGRQSVAGLPVAGVRGGVRGCAGGRRGAGCRRRDHMAH